MARIEIRKQVRYLLPSCVVKGNRLVAKKWAYLDGILNVKLPDWLLVVRKGEELRMASRPGSRMTKWSVMPHNSMKWKIIGFGGC